MFPVPPMTQGMMPLQCQPGLGAKPGQYPALQVGIQPGAPMRSDMHPGGSEMLMPPLQACSGAHLMGAAGNAATATATPLSQNCGAAAAQQGMGAGLAGMNMGAMMQQGMPLGPPGMVMPGHPGQQPPAPGQPGQPGQPINLRAQAELELELSLRGSLLVQQQRRIVQLEDELNKAWAEIERLRGKVQTFEREKKRADEDTKSKQPRYWTSEEHRLFLEALEKYGPKNVKSISNYVATRTPTQVRTHAQKYFLRMTKGGREDGGHDSDAGEDGLGNKAPAENGNEDNSGEEEAEDEDIDHQPKRLCMDRSPAAEGGAGAEGGQLQNEDDSAGEGDGVDRGMANGAEAAPQGEGQPAGEAQKDEAPANTAGERPQVGSEGGTDAEEET